MTHLYYAKANFRNKLEELNVEIGRIAMTGNSEMICYVPKVLVNEYKADFIMRGFDVIYDKDQKQQYDMKVEIKIKW